MSILENNQSASISPLYFIKSIFKFSIASWINFVVGIGAVVITTRIFSPDLYGIINIFNNASNFLLGIFCLGLDSSFIRFYYEPPCNYDKKQLFLASIIIPIILLLLSTFLSLIFFYNQISQLIFGNASWLITLFLFINTLSLLVLRYLNTSYRMDEQIKMYTIQSVLVQVFSKVFLIIGVLFNPNNQILILAFNALGVFILTIVYCFIQKKNIFPDKLKFTFRGLRELLLFGIGIWPTIIIQNSITFLTGLIISKKLSFYELGIYASAAVFVAILGVAQSGFTTYWAAFMYKYYNSEQKKIIKVHNFILLSCIFCMIAFLIFRDVLFLFLGAKYQGCKSFFTLLLVAPILSIIGETTGYGISISKKTYYHLITIIISVSINLSLCFILIPYYNIAGAAFASAAAGTIWFVLRTYFGQKYYLSIESKLKTTMSILLILLLAYINYLYTNSYLIIFSTCVIISLITIIIFRHEFKNIIEMINHIMNLRKNIDANIRED